MQTLEYLDLYELINLSDLLSKTREYKEQGYRLVQLLPKMQEDDRITLIYTFNKLNEVINLKIENVVKGLTKVPSITSIFISAFVFENEAHDLFGVEVVGNSLDFHGHFYNFAEGIEAPMTIVTPAQIAAREKKAKLEAAKKAKAEKLAKQAKEQAGQSDAPSKAKAEEDAELEAKLASMDPEKAAKVRAAMKAKAARDAKKKAETTKASSNSETSNAESVVPEEKSTSSSNQSKEGE